MACAGCEARRQWLVRQMRELGARMRRQRPVPAKPQQEGRSA